MLIEIEIYGDSRRAALLISFFAASLKGDQLTRPNLNLMKCNIFCPQQKPSF